MKKYKVEVKILLKEELLDPQGRAVENALRDLGLKGVQDTRVGKVIKFVITGNSEEDLKREIEEKAIDLLANPVIEDWKISIEEI
jgi:phosphoribosylformylglycinamidine synthase